MVQDTDCGASAKSGTTLLRPGNMPTNDEI
jgi:hypothetical protein